MIPVRRKSWTATQIDLLLALVEKGVSPARASVVLRRPRLAVQTKARQLGKPFPPMRQAKAARLAREASQLEAIGRRALLPKPEPHPAHPDAWAAEARSLH